MKMPNMMNMLPMHKKGMGTTTKVLMVSLPIIAFVAGRMMGNNRNGEENW